MRLVFSSLCVRCDATRIDYTPGASRPRSLRGWHATDRPATDANAATFAINAVFPRAAHAILRLGDVVRIVSERIEVGTRVCWISESCQSRRAGESECTRTR